VEAEIGRLAYSLYGLTRDEIAIIEESLEDKVADRKADDHLELDQDV